MRLRAWTAAWAGIAVLAACNSGDGPLEQAGEDLDTRIENTAEAAADLERASNQIDVTAETVTVGD